MFEDKLTVEREGDVVKITFDGDTIASILHKTKRSYLVAFCAELILLVWFGILIGVSIVYQAWIPIAISVAGLALTTWSLLTTRKETRCQNFSKGIDAGLTVHGHLVEYMLKAENEEIEKKENEDKKFKPKMGKKTNERRKQ